MDCVWDTSKYDHKLSLNIFKVIQGHEVKRRSNKKKMFGTRDTCFKVSFREKLPLNTLNRPNRINFENRENMAIPGNS